MRLFGKNKRGIELAINFLVTFILAVVIFGAGLFIVWDVGEMTENELNDIVEGLDKRITELSCSTKDKVCIAGNEAKTKRGKTLYFTVNLNNYLSTPMNFTITVDNTTAKAYKGDNEIENIRPLLLPSQQNISINPKSQGQKAFAVVMPKNTLAGQYFYTVRVVAEDQNKYANVSDKLIFTVG